MNPPFQPGRAYIRKRSTERQETRIPIHSPAQVDVLMRCYWSPDVTVNAEHQHTQEIIRAFAALGVLDIDIYNKASCTALGRAWVHAILATPIPQTAFIDGNGNVIPE